MSTKQEKVKMIQSFKKFADRLPEFDVANLRFAHKLNRPTSSYIFNFVNASLTKEPVACYCEELHDCLPSTCFSEGHLLCADPAAVYSVLSREEISLFNALCEGGAKFRLSKSVPMVLEDMKKYMDTQLQAIPELLRAEILEDYSRRLIKEAGQEEYRFPKFDLKCLSLKVHDRTTVAPADKNAQKFVFWCPKFYQQKLLQHLDSPHFQDVPQSALQIVQKIQKDVAAFGYDSSMSLPYLYLLAKLHRLEPTRASLRPISGKTSRNVPEGVLPNKVPGSCLSAISSLLAQAQNSMIDLLVHADSKKKIRRCWITRTDSEFIDCYGKLSGVTSLRTDDFTSAYTHIPLDSLRECMAEAFTDVAMCLAQRFGVSVTEAWHKIHFNTQGFWEFHARPYAQYNLDYFLRVFNMILDNAYISSLGTLKKQIIGIFMGNEIGPPTCNLFFYVKEKRFVDALIAKISEDVLLRLTNGYRYVLRFIDDRVSPDFPKAVVRINNRAVEVKLLPDSSDYGLTINQTGSGKSVVFLGIQATINQHASIEFAARDKQHGFEFRLVRYPSWHSAVPDTVRIGSVVGSLVRSQRLTTRMELWFTEVEFLLSIFQGRSYSYKDVKSGIIKFCARNICKRYEIEIRDRLLDFIKNWRNPTPIRIAEQQSHSENEVAHQDVSTSSTTTTTNSTTREFQLPPQSQLPNLPDLSPADGPNFGGFEPATDSREVSLPRSEVETQTEEGLSRELAVPVSSRNDSTTQSSSNTESATLAVLQQGFSMLASRPMGEVHHHYHHYTTNNVDSRQQFLDARQQSVNQIDNRQQFLDARHQSVNQIDNRQQFLDARQQSVNQVDNRQNSLTVQNHNTLVISPQAQPALVVNSRSPSPSPNAVSSGSTVDLLRLRDNPNCPPQLRHEIVRIFGNAQQVTASTSSVTTGISSPVLSLMPPPPSGPPRMEPTSTEAGLGKRKRDHEAVLFECENGDVVDIFAADAAGNRKEYLGAQVVSRSTDGQSIIVILANETAPTVLPPRRFGIISVRRHSPSMSSSTNMFHQI
jgi:hypothetical protein